MKWGVASDGVFLFNFGYGGTDFPAGVFYEVQDGGWAFEFLDPTLRKAIDQTPCRCVVYSLMGLDWKKLEKAVRSDSNQDEEEPFDMIPVIDEKVVKSMILYLQKKQLHFIVDHLEDFPSGIMGALKQHYDIALRKLSIAHEAHMTLEFAVSATGDVHLREDYVRIWHVVENRLCQERSDISFYYDLFSIYNEALEEYWEIEIESAQKFGILRKD